MTEPIDSNLIETCRSPTNIAVIKYWGKRDKKKNLPLNSSVSVTLDPVFLEYDYHEILLHRIKIS